LALCAPAGASATAAINTAAANAAAAMPLAMRAAIAEIIGLPQNFFDSYGAEPTFISIPAGNHRDMRLCNDPLSQPSDTTTPPAPASLHRIVRPPNNGLPLP
jgi:hypothetical protein